MVLFAFPTERRESEACRALFAPRGRAFFRFPAQRIRDGVACFEVSLR
jgi:hypothetical protein